MMPADTFVYIFKYDLAFVGCDASLEDTRYTFLVEFTFYYRKGLGPSSNSSSFDWVFREFLVYQVRQVLLHPRGLYHHHFLLFIIIGSY